jgi:dTDP-4-amino-4,6-dideoxygalactose transaminase
VSPPGSGIADARQPPANRDGTPDVTTEPIPFNLPYQTGNELDYAAEAQRLRHLSGNGAFSKRCHQWLESQTGCARALLTHSCTSALELSALLLEIRAGDEIIMPSFTFVSTANAFVLRGAIPVFVDIRADTLNLDEALIEPAITPRTRAIVAMHYAGVACEMDAIIAVAKRHNLKIVEDAAQGVMASYRGRALGAIGDLGTYSFHETKNISSGEGGSLLVNAPELIKRAEIIWENGTDRSRFLRGEVDKYTWQDAGSSFLPNELTAAFLLAQLQQAQMITEARRQSWQRYHTMLHPLEQQGLLHRPVVPDECEHNGHIYYVILGPDIERQSVLAQMKHAQIGAVFHYVPLHSSPGGMHFGRAAGDLPRTNSLSRQLVRLPMWYGISEAQQTRVVDVLGRACSDNRAR